MSTTPPEAPRRRGTLKVRPCVSSIPTEGRETVCVCRMLEKRHAFCISGYCKLCDLHSCTQVFLSQREKVHFYLFVYLIKKKEKKNRFYTLVSLSVVALILFRFRWPDVLCLIMRWEFFGGRRRSRCPRIWIYSHLPAKTSFNTSGGIKKWHKSLESQLVFPNRFARCVCSVVEPVFVMSRFTLWFALLAWSAFARKWRWSQYFPRAYGSALCIIHLPSALYSCIV